MSTAGKRLSQETRQRMREAHLGRRLSAETRKKISATLKKQWAEIKRLQAEAA
jgi:hypothetical protein